MKKKSSSKSGFTNTRNLLGVFLCLSGMSLAMLSFAATPSKQKVAPKQKTAANLQPVHGPSAPVSPNAPTPPSGTLSPANPIITYTDTLVENTTGVVGAPVCNVPNTCSDFMLTVNAQSVAATKEIFIEGTWTPAQNDFDIYIEDTGGNVIAQNSSTANPSALILPIPADGTVYHIFILASVGAGNLNGLVQLIDIPSPVNQGPGAPPRYMNYPAAAGQANGGEPSIGTDWNPNVASLKDTTSPIFTTGIKRLNTGGVALYTTAAAVNSVTNWRANFDDCPSPAVNLWENISVQTTPAGLDVIGFTDHYNAGQLGIAYPPPHTPGRHFFIDLGAGDSVGSISDNDGNSYTPGGNGGPGQGPDHETLGGGPYHSPLPAVGPVYNNAIYYCSQSLTEAECSRSDDGGQTFAPAVPIFNPTVCLGGIHGHVKVSPQGTVYVPNSACFSGTGNNGAAISTNNGITWNQFTVPGSTGDQDPSIGIGQNNVGKPAGQVPNTIYLGYVSADGHAHAAHSPDEGATWQDDIDVGSILGVQNAVFPVVVAGDDNRAAFGFIGTTTSGIAAFSDDGSFHGIWHLYIATTYNGGQSWILIDATPIDPVQTGQVCLKGTGCAHARNLLDFNDFTVDAEGRGLLAYADGCVNCNNTFTGQSGAAHGTIARQSGGRRLFSAFDPIEPMPPASPQMLSAVRVSGPPSGVLVSWLEPDNGGSPITGYDVFRSTTSGGESFLAMVSGETTTKYFDPSPPPPPGNAFYYVKAINVIGGGDHCGEVSLSAPPENYCIPPGVTVTTDPAGDEVAAQAGGTPEQDLDVQLLKISEPFISASDNSVTFTLKTASLAPPLPPSATWFIRFNALDSTNVSRALLVEMDTNGTGPNPPPAFHIGRTDVIQGQSGDTTQSQLDSLISGRFTADGTITIKLTTQTAMAMTATGAPNFTVTLVPGMVLSSVKISSAQLIGAAGNGLNVFTDQDVNNGGVQTYTLKGNQSCKPETFPIPLLAGNPLTGVAPLTVNFDGSASTDADGDTIASYTLDFGDGTAPVTQASPMFSHAYNSNGDYPARLTVTDSRGFTSVTFSQLVVSVASTFNKAVSRKFHPGFGNGDINLPLAGSPRGVECRSTGNGAYTIVYSFLRNITAVDHATVTQGTATIDTANSALGPLPNQYTVALTGVTNAQYLNVQLDGVHDTAGAILNQAIAQVGILFGDVNASGRVDGTDVSLIRQQNFQPLTNTTGGPADTIREDINVSGRIDGTDVSFARQQNFTVLPSSP